MQSITNDFSQFANDDQFYSSLVFDPAFSLLTPFPLPTPFLDPSHPRPLTSPPTLFDLSWLDGPTPNVSEGHTSTIDSHHGVQPNDSLQSVASRHTSNQKNLNEIERCELLQKDEFVLWFTGKKVTCGGCLKEIKLDARKDAMFYPGFWLKHKRICKGIIAIKKEREEFNRWVMNFDI